MNLLRQLTGVVPAGGNSEQKLQIITEYSSVQIRNNY